MSSLLPRSFFGTRISALDSERDRPTLLVSRPALRSSYTRESLATLLPPKFHALLTAYGPPSVDSDPELQVMAAEHCAYVIRFVLRSGYCEQQADALVDAEAFEKVTAKHFAALALARRQTIGHIAPELLLEAAPPPIVPLVSDPCARARAWGYDPVKLVDGKVVGLSSDPSCLSLFIGITDHFVEQTTPPYASRSECLVAFAEYGTPIVLAPQPRTQSDSEILSSMLPAGDAA